ncbi:hypothetical protein JYK00_03785 [Thermosipho ferrireducens]|uniref:Uncharacterized protein n=1 Tax=Thermosipho ferrireducens TaxID=2571116 RepID=A0ABX7SB89_9BACT|nr:hypothetical protein [Thermosipho ferrireducens]QTA38640.1 hypothetical protein JYK00_03785 [Thermosipho ferrireducens]
MKKVQFYILLIIVPFLLISCVSKQVYSNGKLYITVPKVATIGKTTKISVLSESLIGLTNGTLEIDGTVISFSKIPTNVIWTPEHTGEFVAVAKAFSLADGKSYEATATILVIDDSTPSILSWDVLPKEIDTTKEVILHIAVKSDNNKVSVKTFGEKAISIEASPGNLYIPLGKFDTPELKELFLLVDNMYGKQDATTVVFNVNPYDTMAPDVQLQTNFSYPPNTNVIVTLRANDDVSLQSYRVELDGNIVAEATFTSGTKSISGIPISLGMLSTGQHSVIARVKDWLDRETVIGKRIIVGDTTLTFEVAISPQEDILIPGHTAIISMIPLEEGIEFSKIVFFVDGTEIARYEGSAPQRFTEWTIKEGPHYISIYAESTDGRAGLNERWINVVDNDPPEIKDISANGKSLLSGDSVWVVPGPTKFTVKVYDEGGILKDSTPLLYIREDNFDYYYDVIELALSEYSADGKEATFTGSSVLGIGYYNIAVSGVKDKSYNELEKSQNYILNVGF